jgi:hypothetical protein
MPRALKTDPGLAEIDRWVSWFRAAHLERITTLGLERTEREHDIAAVDALAAAIGERMRADYLGRVNR